MVWLLAKKKNREKIKEGAKKGIALGKKEIKKQQKGKKKPIPVKKKPSKKGSIK